MFRASIEKYLEGATRPSLRPIFGHVPACGGPERGSLASRVTANRPRSPYPFDERITLWVKYIDRRQRIGPLVTVEEWAVRIFWQSFVDASVNAPYIALLSEYLNQIAAPG